MISATTSVLAIIGDPIEHSLTPRIQNAAWRETGRDVANLAFRVPPSRLKSAVQGARSLGLLGLMVTIPHKEAVLACCDTLDDSARLMGAANLLHFADDGRTIGYSTDGWAALTSLEEEGHPVAGSSVAIIGGGGAARSLALTFAPLAHQVLIFNRTFERAQAIAEEAQSRGGRARALPFTLEALREGLPEVDLLVNATSIGMSPHVERSPIPGDLLHAALTVYDAVYNPLETRLLRDARAAGARAIDGLGMLIYTNVRAAQICAGTNLDPGTMRAEAMEALAAHSP